VKDVIRTVERIIGRRVSVIPDARRPGDPPTLIASPEQARRVLGWNAKYVGLDEIVATAWQWQDKTALSAAAAI
jgi:UDP-glucose 4-epimerase